MYETIYVPVDNSPHSNRAVDTAVTLGSSFASSLVGCHVYAARMHDYRFKQMEYTLPEEYLVEQELHRQRKIHDSLITMGLELVSDCYLQAMDEQCRDRGLECERKMMDGKHSEELIADIEGSGYDLVVMGALGVGRTRDSQIGAVCARVTQHCFTDTWVVRHVPAKGEPERDTVLVGVDGSPKSFGALTTAIELCRRFDKKLEIIGVYDPYLHYAVFKGIVDVLTDQAAKVFRFEEQNQLHEEIIDTGLASIYQSHVNIARQMAAEAGIEASTTLLDGKAFQKVLDHARAIEPWVLVVGRVGVHSQADDTGLGSNTENLLRLAPCDVLLTTTDVVPELDLKAEETIHWTPEALERMDRVPPQVLGIARTAILRLALEHGHSVVSSDLVTEAMERFMPKSTAEANLKLAEAVVLDRAAGGGVAICASCGVAARTADALQCTVCGSTELERLSSEVVERIIDEEGGAEEETTYDGRKVRWTQDSRQALKRIEDRYQRRRAKARIEKAARVQGMEVVTAKLAERFVDEEIGVLYGGAATRQRDNGTTGEHPEAADVDRRPTGGPSGAGTGNGSALEGDDDRRLVARDADRVPLLSSYGWTAEAVTRILRVPAGFMRDKTQARIEELALERDLGEIDLAVVEEGIARGLRMMEEMLAQTGTAATGKAAEEETAAANASRCPVHRALEQGETATVRQAMSGYPLTEVSVVTEMDRKRAGLDEQSEK